MTTYTAEYKAICSCRVDLTKKLSTCVNEVAKHLRQNGALTDEQCQAIISAEDGAEKLMKIIIVFIEDPVSTLDSFAYLVTALKKGGNRFIQEFVKDKIEAKRREIYREEFLQVPHDFLASKYHVFISHSREADTMHTVDILILRLKQEGLSVFVDQRSNQPGDKWPFEIASAIKTCNAFVVVLSKRYVRSVYCNGELFEAEALGKCMFPVVCEDSWRDVPGGAPVMEVVRDVQDVSLVAGNTENQLTRLVQGIKGAVGLLSPVAVDPDSPTNQAGIEEAEMSSLQAADTSTDEDSSDEAGPDSLLQKHKYLIDKCREVLCGLLDPSQVILQLRKQGVFTQLDQQTILARPTDLEQTGHILDQLFRRGPHALHEFVRCLKSFEDKYSSIAYTLQPVNHRILWFASSPTLAAAVVHTLEEYNAAKFPEFPGKMGPKSKYIVRRASVFVKWIPVEDSDLDDSLDIFDCVDDIEVCLVFPTAERSGHVTEAMTAAFQECPRPSIAVMSGMCEGVDVRALDGGSDVIIVNGVRTQFPQIDLDPPTTEIAKKTIQTKFTRSTEWSKRFTRRHSIRPKEPLMNCIDTNPPQPLDTSLHTTYVSDDGHTHQFYELCRSKLPGETPFLATVGVVNKECPEETRSSYAVLSSIVTMETCRTFMEKH